jgi:hypothetical protein
LPVDGAWTANSSASFRFDFHQCGTASGIQYEHISV